MPALTVLHEGETEKQIKMEEEADWVLCVLIDSVSSRLGSCFWFLCFLVLVGLSSKLISLNALLIPKILFKAIGYVGCVCFSHSDFFPSLIWQTFSSPTAVCTVLCLTVRWHPIPFSRWKSLIKYFHYVSI